MDDVASHGVFLDVCRDYRVWILFLLYGACFGIELTMDNVAALYFKDHFQLTLKAAGIVASSFGMMNLFARALGGSARRRRRVSMGIERASPTGSARCSWPRACLAMFASLTTLAPAVGFHAFGLFVCMGCGATYAVTPFINRNGMGQLPGSSAPGETRVPSRPGFC